MLRRSTPPGAGPADGEAENAERHQDQPDERIEHERQQRERGERVALGIAPEQDRIMDLHTPEFGGCSPNTMGVCGWLRCTARSYLTLVSS